MMCMVYSIYMKGKHITAFIAALLIILGAGALFLFAQQGGLPTLPLMQAPQNSSSANTGGAITSPSSITIGPKNAKVTVVEFLDFQCPFCRAVHPTFMKIMQDYADQPVRFMFRHFPLISIHPLALPASNASLCAHEQDKFLPYYNLLYTRQDEISLAGLVSFAQGLGLNLKQFNTCLAEKRYESLIRQDVSDALSLHIEGTPTWFVNDTRLVGALPYETFKAAIDKELTK